MSTVSQLTSLNCTLISSLTQEDLSIPFFAAIDNLVGLSSGDILKCRFRGSTRAQYDLAHLKRLMPKMHRRRAIEIRSMSEDRPHIFRDNVYGHSWGWEETDAGESRDWSAKPWGSPSGEENGRGWLEQDEAPSRSLPLGRLGMGGLFGPRQADWE